LLTAALALPPAARSGWEGAANWMASQSRGELMIAAQIVARKSFVEV